MAWRKVCGETRFLANDGTILVAAAAVLLQLEANAGSFEGIAVAVDKNGFIFPARPSFQESLQEFNRLWPERTGPLLSPFAEQSNLKG